MLFGCRFLSLYTSHTTLIMSTNTKQTKKPAGRSALQDVVAREYTIHLHKRVGFYSFCTMDVAVRTGLDWRGISGKRF